MAANFTQDLQNFRASSSFPFLDSIAPTMEQINNSYLSFSMPTAFSSNVPDTNFFEFPGNLPETFPGNIFHQPNCNNGFQAAAVCDQSTVTSTDCESNKRKAMEMASESSHENSSPVKRKNNSGRRRKEKGNEKEEEKLKEVVHVRARRGQATDSHSLAERVRRGKINERLRCLQDIVPGCYKTMGMATMLDEIINYVQSLQNQVEFLSLKLTAASTFYDFNSESEALEKMQAREMERLMKEAGYNGNFACASASSSLSISRPI